MGIHGHNNIKLLRMNNDNRLLTYIFTIIKLFLFVGLGAGLLFGIVQSLRTSSISGLIDGITFGAILALITVPIVTILDIFERVRCYLKYKIVDFGVIQERRFLTKTDYDIAFKKIFDILNEIKKMEVTHKDSKQGVIEALVKRSWKSFGEKIRIELSKNAKGEIEASLTSKPRITLTAIDYCKNLENVEMIMQYVNRAFNTNI